MRQRIEKFLYAAMAALFLSGCRTAPDYLRARTVQYAPFPDQAKTVEDPAKARIYFIRPYRFQGSGVSFEFYGGSTGEIGSAVNGEDGLQLIGEVGPGSYLCWEQPPPIFMFLPNNSDLNHFGSLDVEAGHVYYLCLTPIKGLRVINETEAKALLKNCQPPDNYRKGNP